MSAVVVSSPYIDETRREYSMYVIHNRALVSESDGLKSSGRRLLWVARDGSTYKVANLAGAALPYHPHSPPEGTANTLAGFYVNNIPLLAGEGAFGTMMNPKGFGAARYTSAKASAFTKDAIYVDMDIIPMVPNYDQTLMEPQHFLPLVPISLLNPSEGVAVGFACSILPRSLPDIIQSMLLYMAGKKFKEPPPTLVPVNSRATHQEANGKWVFEGTFDILNASQVKITGLPYDLSHAALIAHLTKLEDAGTIKTFDDASSSEINIIVTLPRGVAKSSSHDELVKLLGLVTKVGENIAMVSFDGNHVVNKTYGEIISSFCEWRIPWYKARYTKKIRDTQHTLAFYQGIVDVVDKKLVPKITQAHDKDDLLALFTKHKVSAADRMVELPAYRFTASEYAKAQDKINTMTQAILDYTQIVNSHDLQKAVFVSEVEQLLTWYKAGKYVVNK